MATASAVASSGNIGPGFDVLALALDLRCEVRAELADDCLCDAINAAAGFEQVAEYRAKADDNRNEAERSTHAITNGIHDLTGRHVSTKTHQYADE